jgi:hypothetical protein
VKPPRPSFGRTSRLLDSLIGVVSPSRALARVKARALMTAAVAAYESAAYGNSVWGTLRASTTLGRRPAATARSPSAIAAATRIGTTAPRARWSRARSRR